MGSLPACPRCGRSLPPPQPTRPPAAEPSAEGRLWLSPETSPYWSPKPVRQPGQETPGGPHTPEEPATWGGPPPQAPQERHGAWDQPAAWDDPARRAASGDGYPAGTWAAGPGGESWPGPSEEPSEPWRLRNRRWPKVVLVVVPALLALALVWWLVAGRSAGPTHTGTPTGSIATASPDASTEPTASSPTPGETPDETPAPAATKTDTKTDTKTGTAGGSGEEAGGQAKAIDTLLAGSHSARSGLSDAIASVSGCDGSGADTIASITDSRREQLASARNLDVSSLSGGDDLKATLIEALDASADADAAFLSWARRYLEGGCTGPVTGDEDYVTGLDRSADAQNAKTRFVEQWRPVAAALGLTLWRVDQI
ncbi:hypothetical protein ACQP25_10535 [Microtetraspora malaysiensis]|uniref:hypothetical protein n=1 Tax=Microtetraspora malaysiensis TaxID=161358 RepID=UPI003D8A3B5C